MKRGLTLSLALALLLFAAVVGVCPRFSSPPSFAIYDREEVLLGASVASDGQWRLRDKPVPNNITACILTFEDRRFYIHPGIDPLALARAFYQNAASRTVVSGGSTITMQTVRLSRNNPERTLPQKAIEAFLAVILEIRYTKTEILSLYAANAPFGGNVVGIEAAAWRYYGRSSDNLTWAEAATLAVLPNQPALVHPGGDRIRLKEKRDRLLRALRDANIITAGEYTLSLEEPIPEQPYPLPRLAKHYLERQKKVNISITTIDRSLQRSVTEILERWSAQFSESGIENGAAFVIDTRTGKTLAYAGNTGAERDEHNNADVDIITARRSSGSLLKPFLFAGMLDAGLLLPDQLVVDIPTRVGSYKPENNLPVYQGVVPAGEALSRSINVPAVRELRDYGISPFLTLFKEAGFTTFDRTADEYGLPLILGGGELTLEEAVYAYAALMNKADISQSDIAQSDITQSDIASENSSKDDNKRSPFSCGAAWLTLEALVEGGRPNDEALWQSFASAQKIAWKTGTSYGNRDAWAIGVTPSYCVGIWIGNATGEGRPELKSITTAAPVLFDIFSILPRAAWPPRPEMALKRITICAQSGFTAGPDCAEQTEGWKPRNAGESEVCPYCRKVSLTPDSAYQATTSDLKGKWSGSLPLVRSQFVLPPAIEYWYTRQSLSYRRLPEWIAGHVGGSSKGDLAILFPESGARIFIPTEIDGTKGLIIFEATHRSSDETIYWDIDGEFMGETQKYHQISRRVESGAHVLTVTDTRGNRACQIVRDIKRRVTNQNN